MRSNGTALPQPTNECYQAFQVKENELLASARFIRRSTKLASDWSIEFFPSCQVVTA